MPKNSQVTVFIPTFNRLALLKRAVESVLSQGDGVRLHILDNASNDGTRAWLEKLASQHPCITVTSRKENIGALANFVEGFNAVKTPFCLPLADDDALIPDFLPEAVKIAETDSHLGAVVFQTETWRNGKLKHKSPSDPSSGKYEPLEHLPMWAASGHYFSWSSILWSSKAIKSLNLMEQLERFGSASDVWFQFRIFLQYPVFLVPKSGSIFNQHDTQCSRRSPVTAYKELGAMNHELKRCLTSSRLFDEDKVDEMMRLIAIRWNQLLHGYLLNLQMPSTKLLRDILEIYSAHYIQYCGFDYFPLSRAYDSYFSEPDANREVTSLRKKLSWMEKSLSWRATEPLRKCLTLARGKW